MFTLMGIGAATMSIAGISQVVATTLGATTVCSCCSNKSSGSVSGSTSSQWKYPVKVSSLSSFLDDDDEDDDLDLDI
jgi:hypothetical protein